MEWCTGRFRREVERACRRLCKHQGQLSFSWKHAQVHLCVTNGTAFNKAGAHRIVEAHPSGGIYWRREVKRTWLGATRHRVRLWFIAVKNSRCSLAITTPCGYKKGAKKRQNRSTAVALHCRVVSSESSPRRQATTAEPGVHCSARY